MPLRLIRPGLAPAEDRQLVASPILWPQPEVWPELTLGELARALPDSFEPIGASRVSHAGQSMRGSLLEPILMQVD